LELAEELNAAVLADADKFTGAAFCSDFEGMVVFVKASTDEVADQVARITDSYTGLPVELREVGASWAELIAAADQVTAAGEYQDVVSAAGPNPLTGGLSVNVCHTSLGRDPAELVDQEALETDLGVPVALSSVGCGHSELRVAELARENLQWLLDYPPMVAPPLSVWPQLDPTGWRASIDRAYGQEPAPAVTPAVVETDGCLQINQLGDIVTQGDLPADLQRLADQLNTAAGQAPDSFTGTAYCAGYEGIVVFVKAETSQITDQIMQIAAAHPAYTVEVRAVGASWAELEAAAVKAVNLPQHKDAITGAGADIRAGGVSIDVHVDEAGQDPAELVDANALQTTLGVPVRLRATAGN
jgi:hypothetical protein